MSVERKNATKRDKQQSLLALVENGIKKSNPKVNLSPSTDEIQGIIYKEAS